MSPSVMESLGASAQDLLVPADAGRTPELNLVSALPMRWPCLFLCRVATGERGRLSRCPACQVARRTREIRHLISQSFQRTTPFVRTEVFVMVLSPREWRYKWPDRRAHAAQREIRKNPIGSNCASNVPLCEPGFSEPTGSSQTLR